MARPPKKPRQPDLPASKTTAPATALSIDDVMLIRKRLDAFQPGSAVGGAAPADQIVALVAEKLRSARTEDEARIAALEAKLAAATEQAAATQDDRDAALRGALDAIDALLAELASARARDEARTAELAAVTDRLAQAQRELAEARLASDPRATGAHVLGAATVAALLNDFVGSFADRLDGLQVSSGDVLLKAGFAQLGQGAGFVLPTANAPAGEQPVLHDIRLRLDPMA